MARIIARRSGRPGSPSDLIAGDRQVVAPGAESLQIEGDVAETAVPHRLDDLLPTRHHGIEPVRRHLVRADRLLIRRGRHLRIRGSAGPPRLARSAGAPHRSRRHRTPIATRGGRPRACPRSRAPGRVRGPGPRVCRGALPRAGTGHRDPRRPLARPVVPEVVEVHAQQDRPVPREGPAPRPRAGFLAEGAADGPFERYRGSCSSVVRTTRRDRSWNSPKRSAAAARPAAGRASPRSATPPLVDLARDDRQQRAVDASENATTGSLTSPTIRRSSARDPSGGAVMGHRRSVAPALAASR